MFVDGKVKQIDVILKEDENGETHISSYADDSQPVPVMTLNMESPTLKLIADMRDGLRLVLNQLHNRETFNATELGSRIEPLILRADELLRQLL